MHIDRQAREQLKALSKEIFGSSSKWQTILSKGTTELLTKTETQVDGTGQSFETVVPVLNANGTKNFYQKYYTLETLTEYLLSLKIKRDEFLAKMAKQKEDDRLKAETAKLLEQTKQELTGSAL